ncbi:AAEL017417-PA [Aedes aegypti]|uniref:AAEL017417-PA n=1 Tax=Aedes aegypti TaxID=7159 RepID=J9EAB6_AEDAE|nr:AAEL017417-PA [Aedes aegypti]
MLFSVLSKNYWMSYRYFDFWFLFLNSRCFFFRFRISGRLEHDSGKFQGKVKR